MSNQSLGKFYDNMIDGGSILVTCSCGRTHIADDEINQLEDSEITEIKKNEAVFPDRYIHYPCTTIEILDLEPIFGIVVVGCPCKKDELIHEFLFNNRRRILKFYSQEIACESEILDAHKKLLSQTDA